MRVLKKEQDNHRLLKIAITALIGIMPITMMTELRGGSANFWALLIFCLALSLIRVDGITSTINSLKNYRSIYITALLMPITVVLAMTWSHQWLGGDAERATRVFFGLTIILSASLSMSKDWLRQSTWGIIAGVIGGAGSIIWMTWPHFKRPDMDQYTTVGYSNILLILIVMVACSFEWTISRYKRIEQILKLFTILIGLIGLAIAETRTSWIAMPLFILIGLYLVKPKLNNRKIYLLILSIFITCSIVFFAKPMLLERFKLAAKEIVECPKSNYLAENSVCTRIQLWNASLHMFKANPYLANAGSERFEEELEKLHKQGIVTEATKNEFGEPHNDLLHALANYGIVGFIAYLLVYLVPGSIFIKRMSFTFSQDIRVAAAMGTILCIGFLVFGLTESMFRSMRMLSFYIVMIAWLLALSDTESKN